MQEPPQILRVKRKRTEDPLQALVIETSKRQIKRPKYVFRLKRTEEKDIQDFTAVLTASNSSKDNKPVFNLPARKKSVSDSNGTILNGGSRGSISEGSQDHASNIVDEQPMELNPQLLEMLNDYLKDNDETAINNHVKPPKRRQSSISQERELNGRPNFDKEQMLRNAIAIDEDDNNDSDYVYDVYYRDKAINDQWNNGKIGYIRFEDDDDANFFDEQDELMMNTDDEDSNDENFYRNDYPDDEDAGYEEEAELESLGLAEPSDDQDDEFDILNDKRRFSRQDFLRTEGLNGLSADDLENLTTQIDEKQVWRNTDDVLEDDNDDPDVDYSRSNEDDDAMEMDSYADTDHFNESDAGFERNEFFKSDKDDPMAIHRDRIFGKLQDMIHKKS